MEYRRRQDLKAIELPGRILQNAVGKDETMPSQKITMLYATYAPQSGPMQPHKHAEEVVVILDTRDGKVRYGGESDALLHELRLEPGMVLHFPADEWHVFEYDEDGFIDALCMYGQVDNLR